MQRNAMVALSLAIPRPLLRRADRMTVTTHARRRTASIAISVSKNSCRSVPATEAPAY